MHISKEHFLKLQNMPHVWNTLLDQVGYKQQQVHDKIYQANLLRVVDNMKKQEAKKKFKDEILRSISPPK